MLMAMASDHAGFGLKTELKSYIESCGHDVLDLGAHAAGVSVDYPDFGKAMALALKDGKATRGVLICGSGIGISIAANRFPWVRAALCHDVTSARLTRLHNDANVLALGARLIGTEVAKDCVDVFLSTAFEGGRHASRVAKLGEFDGL